jgi:non-specific serine/threonine protein kinase/serine/threonine-protein kinase
MSPEQWQKVKSVLELAIEIPTESRVEFLDKMCGDDDVLRKDVEILLGYENTKAELFEKSPLADLLQNDPAKNDAKLIGTQIGKYKIIGELGAGGMGAVYLAERADGEFQQMVALKLIKRGMDSDAVLRRFLNERQILASLEHPNIAHLIDGGTTGNDLPFFVMEYVEGEPLIEYARRKHLDLKERLNIFLKVCAAVSFAHQNLVIHRDLKPSNILITKDQDVKLLDFGIAKLLKDESAESTATQMQIFTPEYASPEQIKGEKLTTATDVYSLGVILYELLTEMRPYQTNGKSISEIIRAVCETEPVRPSAIVNRIKHPDKNKTAEGNQITANERNETNPQSQIPNSRLLRGDPDNIVLKALRKEPECRYSSVEQFAEDIRRYLIGLPVSASSDSWGYRAQKFIRRNQLAMTAAGLILITLFGGLFATLYQANKAQRRFDDVRRLANSFLFEFHDSIENLPGATPARELVVKRALEYLDKLNQESGNDPAIQRELATAYERIGKIQGNSYYLNLGDTEGATRSVRTALAMREKLIAEDPNNQELQFELASSYQAVGDMLYTVNELEDALENYKKSFGIREKLSAAVPDNLDYQYMLALNHSRIGDVTGLEGYPNLGDTPGSIENYRKAVAIGEKLTVADPQNGLYENDTANWTMNLSMLESTTGDNKNAILNGQKAIAVFEKITAAEPNNVNRKMSLLSAYNVIRFPLTEEMRFEEATRILQLTKKMLEEMSAADPKNTFIRRSLGVSHNSLGRTQVEAGDPEPAIENHRKALKIAEELRAADPTNGENTRDTALTLEFTANAQFKARNFNAALENYRKSLAIFEKQLSGGGSDDLAGVYSGIGKCLAANGNLSEAVETFRRAVSLAEQAAQKSPDNVRKQSRLAIYYLEGGKTLSKMAQTISGKPADRAEISREAKIWLEKSAEIFSRQQASGKLSKINATFPAEIQRELKSLL